MVSTATMTGDKDVTMKDMEMLAFHRVLEYLCKKYGVN